MRLSDAALYFDDLVCADAYLPTHKFKGQLDLFDDSRRDGYSVERRILSVAPSVTIPAKRVVNIGQDKFIVGQSSTDFFKNSPIRVKYIIHRADGLATSYTISDFLSDTVTKSFYAATSWVKGAKEIDESSDITDVVSLYYGLNETIAARSILKINNQLYMVRNVHSVPSGFNSAEIDVLDEPNVETISFTSKTYNPVTSAYTSTTVSAKVLRVRWQTKFNYLSMSSLTYEPGDDVVLVKKSVVTPKSGDVIPLSDGNRIVLAVASDGDCWHCHIRRA